MSNQTFPKRTLCRASAGSMTLAIKARRTLEQNGISVSVKKLSAGADRRGCIYGIEYPCELSGNVFSILRLKGVEVEPFLR